MAISSDLFDLTGKNAVITGSSRGIGKAIAESMAAHGARVVISSRKADACEKVVEQINSRYPDRAISIPAHIGDRAQLQALVDTTREKLGRIDILVCNAAVNPYYGPSANIPDSAFEKIMACNVQSNHWLCNMVVSEMIARKDGVIQIVSSIGGLKASTIIGAYNISKAADFALVRNLAAEYGPHNVRVNAIAPGLVRTDFARALWENPEILKQSTASTPLRRIGEPEEIAGVAVFLASRAGSFATGQNFIIDGGQTIT